MKSMKKETRRGLILAGGFLGAFVLWTILLTFLDVRAIGPEGSRVGFATLNGAFHRMTGVNLYLYTLTDWLSLLPVGIVAGFGLLGLIQWIQRGHLLKVDRSILLLGGYYLLVAGAYLLFEVVQINFRPTLIEGALETSYPSSTTVLVLCIMSTAWMQVRERMKGTGVRRLLCVLICLFSGFMVMGRLLSGVHWITDIIGGILLSGALVSVYGSLAYDRS